MILFFFSITRIFECMLTCVGLYTSDINCILISLFSLRFSLVSDLELPVIMGYFVFRPRGKYSVNVRQTIGYVENNTLKTIYAVFLLTSFFYSGSVCFIIRNLWRQLLTFVMFIKLCWLMGVMKRWYVDSVRRIGRGMPHDSHFQSYS
jgi:hypothetical protein